jgi:hypothetical protein
VPPEYSTCSSGAAAALPSHAHAVRTPVPVTMITSGLPLTQPGGFTTCCTTLFKSGVR